MPTFRQIFATGLLTLGMAATCSVLAADIQESPVPGHHAKVFGGNFKCSVCHETELPVERPSSKACIGCHGTMDKIATPPNQFDKFPHASPHYGDSLECTVCHAEHKPSRALCNDCHVVKWNNLR